MLLLPFDAKRKEIAYERVSEKYLTVQEECVQARTKVRKELVRNDVFFLKQISTLNDFFWTENLILVQTERWRRG